MFAGLQVAVIAMASSAWEVRNAASLIFTALLIRMLGFRNLVKVHIHPPPPPETHHFLAFDSFPPPHALHPQSAHWVSGI